VNTQQTKDMRNNKNELKVRKRPKSRNRNQFGNLAMRYYPGRAYKTAIRAFRKEIAETRGLLQALMDTGYKPHQRRFSPRQMQIIEDFLGEP
jgi:hypothetical protein